MNKIKYLIFSVIIFTLTFSYANAECTTEELSSLRQDADKVKVTYKHLGEVDVEDGGVTYNLFNLKFKNLTDDLYIRLDSYNSEWKHEAGVDEISFDIVTGTYNFAVYSEKCQVKLSNIKVKIPRFNMYSLDPLCDGIDGTDFPLCGKYYEYEISYDNFKTRVEDYRKKNKIDESNNNTSKEKFSINTILSRILNFIDEYQLYLLISLIVIFLVLIMIIVIKKKKKRGVLE